MKGLSPMVGVVLLIAFTIGVGGLVSIFATGLTTTSTGIASNQSEAQTRCAGAWLNVYDVQSSRILYSNPNRETITSITITTSSGDSITGSTSLAPGATASTSWTQGTNTSVTLRGLCQTLVTAEGRCDTTEDCWNV